MTLKHDTKFYALASNQLLPVTRAQCCDCARYKALYAKQANGSYKPVADIGYCSMTGFHGIGDMQPCNHLVGNCKDFVPTDPEAVKHLWLKLPI